MVSQKVKKNEPNSFPRLPEPDQTHPLQYGNKTNKNFIRLWIMSYSYIFFSDYMLKKTIDSIIKEIKREKKSRQKKRENPLNN